MDNSLLVVRDINHIYIVVEGRIYGTNLLNGEQVDGLLALSPYGVAILA